MYLLIEIVQYGIAVKENRSKGRSIWAKEETARGVLPRTCGLVAVSPSFLTHCRTTIGGGGEQDTTTQRRGNVSVHTPYSKSVTSIYRSKCLRTSPYDDTGRATPCQLGLKWTSCTHPPLPVVDRKAFNASRHRKRPTPVVVAKRISSVTLTYCVRIANTSVSVCPITPYPCVRMCVLAAADAD